MSFYILQEDGVSRIQLEDGSGFLITEEGGAPPPTVPEARLAMWMRRLQLLAVR